jgi:ABC-2 type transport system permease protein
MSYLTRLYAAQFRKNMAVQLQYRVAAAIWLVGAVVEPTVYLVVWATVAETQGGSVGGLSVGDFAAYYILLMFVEHLTFTWIMWEFDWQIRDGSFSRKLLLPIHPIHDDITDNIAYKLLGLVMLVPAGILLSLTFRPNFNFQPLNLLIFIPVFLIAFLMRFLLGYTLGLAAFWINRVQALNTTYFVLQLFFSGRLTPLELLPTPLRTIASFMPFQWFTAFPVELLLGRVDSADLPSALLTQFGWLVAIFLLFRIVWNSGVRKYAAFGS